MKELKIVILLTILVGNIAPLLAQINNEEQVTLQAIQLNEELAQLFQEEAKCDAFEVDQKGVLRPQKGYHMTYLLKEELIELKQTHITESIHSNFGNFQEVPLPGGRGKIACFCDVVNDDCSFEKTPNQPHRNDYECVGSCNCGVAVVIFPGLSIPVIQTSDGSWHDAGKFSR